MGHGGSGSLSLEEVCQEQHVTLGGCFGGPERWLAASVQTVGNSTLGKEHRASFLLLNLFPLFPLSISHLFTPEL